MFQTNIYYVARMSVELHLQQQLEAAQNVLFCEELFSQLARESMGLQAPIPVSLPASSRSNINPDMPELSSGPVCIPRKRSLTPAEGGHTWERSKIVFDLFYYRRTEIFMGVQNDNHLKKNIFKLYKKP